MNTYDKIITAIHTSNMMIIDDHTNKIIDDMKAVVLLANGEVGLLTKSQHQCINSVYIGKDGICHLSMRSISSLITGVDTDIFEAVNAYNKAFTDRPYKQIVAMYVVV